jgi:hypothetical protein
LKLPYSYVSAQVEILFQKQFKADQELEINQWCNFIIEYIELCGWTSEEYILAMFEEYRGQKENN